MLQSGNVRFLTIVKNLYTPISIVFIIVFAWNNYPLLENLIKTANTTRISLAIALWCLAHTLSPLFSKTVLSALHQSIAYPKLLKIHATRLPARYLPGGIWHTVGRISDLHREGLNKKDLTILVAAESMIPCLTTFTIGGGYLWLSGAGEVFNLIFGIIFSASLVATLILPRLFAKSICYDKRFRNIYIRSILVTTIFWLVASSSFTLYFLSFPLTGNEISLLKIPAAYMFSWAIGFVAIFAPQGIGVFEFVAGNILNLPTTLSGSIVVIAGFRLVNLIADLIVWSTCHVILVIKKRATE